MLISQTALLDAQIEFMLCRRAQQPPVLEPGQPEDSSALAHSSSKHCALLRLYRTTAPQHRPMRGSHVQCQAGAEPLQPQQVARTLTGTSGHPAAAGTDFRVLRFLVAEA
jgi:hypothetical protein